jgi:hypothetical protein
MHGPIVREAKDERARVRYIVRVVLDDLPAAQSIEHVRPCDSTLLHAYDAVSAPGHTPGGNGFTNAA